MNVKPCLRTISQMAADHSLRTTGLASLTYQPEHY